MENFEVEFYLGVDWGEKRIGLALADNETRLAIPFKTATSLEELLKTIEEEEVSMVVVGKPIKMGGEDKKLDPRFLNFIKELKDKLKNISIELIDERLSSMAADKLPGDRKTKASRDEIAASLILQTYLDKNCDTNDANMR